MRAGDKANIEALVERLQPAQNHADARICLSSGDRFQ
jgi:hypothetical protein